jgi:NADPH:quinone reductase-like Zn-dependent oxidoreductase
LHVEVVLIGSSYSATANGQSSGDPADHSNGAFAEHIKVKVGIHAKLGDSMSWEEGATLGVGITTVGQGLYQVLGLPLPPVKVSSHTPILIYGASTATGTLAVQFAKFSGAEVYATASPHNFDLLKKLGADHVFDYRDPSCGEQIRKASNDKLRLAFDCIAEHGSEKICCAAISSAGGHYSGLLPTPLENFPRKDDVKHGWTFGYTALGEKYSDKVPAMPDHYDFGVRFWAAAEKLLNDKTIKTHPTLVRDGLEGIPQGLNDLKENKVSGKKLVYRVQ